MAFDAPIPDDFKNLVALLREDEAVNGNKI